MFSLVLMLLVVMAVAAFAFHIGLALSWGWTAALTVLIAVAVVTAAFTFFRTTAAMIAARDHLVDDVGNMGGRWSVRIQAAVAALALYYATLPEKVQDSIPSSWLAVLAGVGAVATIAAMAVKQPSLQKPQDGGQ